MTDTPREAGAKAIFDLMNAAANDPNKVATPQEFFDAAITAAVGALTDGQIGDMVKKPTDEMIEWGRLDVHGMYFRQALLAALIRGNDA